MNQDAVVRWRSGLRWYWHRQAQNGRIVAQSGPFMTSWGALRNARRRNPDLDEFPIRGH